MNNESVLWMMVIDPFTINFLVIAYRPFVDAGKLDLGR
jgi:hypothetical protein